MIFIYIHYNMFFSVNNKKKIVFGWSAKCGCTHVKRCFNYYTGIKTTGSIHINSYNPLPNNHNEYTIILFIRNPYKRIVSGFLHKYLIGKWRLTTPKTFENFVNELDKNGLLKIDKHHFTPQLSERYVDNMKLHKIYDIENIDYNYLDILFDKKLPKELYSFKGYRNKYSQDNNRYVYNLEFREFSSNIPTYKFFYNQDIKNKVYKFYKRDFEFLKKKGFDYML